MRDYKQMQEVQKLRAQAEAEGDSPTPEQDENQKYTKRSPGFRGWMEYIREYYKWPILIGVIIAVGIIMGISQMVQTANPDLSMMYVGPFYISATEQERLGDSIAQLSGETAGDYNADGAFKYDFLDITISKLTDANGIDYTYDNQNSAYTRFQTEIRAGDTLLYFLEPSFYREALAEGIIAPLSELGIAPTENSDGYGIPIGDMDCYELEGFDEMPPETVVCLRRSPSNDSISYGRTAEDWAYHRDLFVAMAGYLSDSRVIDTETAPDVTLLYVGENAVYKSMRLAIEDLLDTLTDDANGDGKKRGVIESLQRTGNETAYEIASKAIRTELVTGDTFLWVLDEEAYLYAKENGLLEPLPEELQTRDGATDNLALRLSSLPVYNTAGYNNLTSVSYLCLRKSPETETESYGRTAEDYESAKKMFLLLAQYTP